MLFISCRWSKVTGYNCILHDWLYELQRREITGPLSPSVGICVCACTHFCTGCSEQQSIVISLLCSCTTLLGFFFFFLFGIVGFISEDNMKPPQSIFKKIQNQQWPAYSRPAVTVLSLSLLLHLYPPAQAEFSLFSYILWGGVARDSEKGSENWVLHTNHIDFFFNFHLCFSFFSFVLRVNLTFSGFW